MSREMGMLREEARAKIKRLALAATWQPIDTAPPDMRPILAFVRGSRLGPIQEEADEIYIAYLKRPGTYVLQHDGHYIINPSHWMPMPEAPKDLP